MASRFSLSAGLVPVLCLLVLFTAAACGREAPAPDRATVHAAAPRGEVSAASTPIGGEWRLVAIDQRELSAGGAPTVVFGDKGECWGHTGVNSFSTSFKLEGLGSDRIETGTAAVTRKAGPPEAMAIERLFLERLQAARAFEIIGNRLHLHAGQNQGLIFERAEP